MVMEGLRRKLEKLQEDIMGRENERRAPEGARHLHHEKVVAPPQGERSPLERIDPHRAEVARAAEEWRRNQPAPPPQPVVPNRNRPQPVGPGYGNAPTVAAPGVAYVQQTVPAENPNARPAELPLMHPAAKQVLQDPNPMPHEKLAALLDQANEQTLQNYVENRVETMKDYEHERWISGR